jgi:glycosyltransferase involved in cell wall biosynthesis
MLSEITVIIPSYNAGSYLIEALQSVHDQTYKNWKLILVDDFSKDDSIFKARSLLKDPRIMVTRNPYNLGQSISQNRALNYVTTPYVVQLDSDDWFKPDTLEVLVEEFKKQPNDVAVVSGNMEVVNITSRWLSQHNNEPLYYVKKGRNFKDRYDFMLANLSLWPRCIRTSALRDIGGWQVDTPYHGRHMEDMLMLFKLLDKYRFHWVDKVLYGHRDHDNCSTWKYQKEYNFLIEWNMRRTLIRWGDKFEPVFEIGDGGWKNIVALTPKT